MEFSLGFDTNFFDFACFDEFVWTCFFDHVEEFLDGIEFVHFHVVGVVEVAVPVDLDENVLESAAAMRNVAGFVFDVGGRWWFGFVAEVVEGWAGGWTRSESCISCVAVRVRIGVRLVMLRWWRNEDAYGILDPACWRDALGFVLVWWHSRTTLECFQLITRVWEVDEELLQLLESMARHSGAEFFLEFDNDGTECQLTQDIFEEDDVLIERVWR